MRADQLGTFLRENGGLEGLARRLGQRDPTDLMSRLATFDQMGIGSEPPMPESASDLPAGAANIGGIVGRLVNGARRFMGAAIGS